MKIPPNPKEKKTLEKPKNEKDPQDSQDDLKDDATKIGVYLTIPFVLAVSPILGWWIGSWLDKKFDTAPYLMYIGLLFGFVAGFRELYRLIKRFGDGK
jgi:F0F1-type ATP synthase assembly protein I